MHGARGDLPVTVVENASRPDQRVIGATLMDLPGALEAAAPEGPVMILLGLAPRARSAPHRTAGGALMARKFHPQMATANDLLEGDVVYFTSPATGRARSATRRWR